MIRPLVLILKQFLVDRGLLTAFTGGLSSYCLFLMVTRYCQEQHMSSWLDPGSLLIGFLDFFGNHFDPRNTGISVKQRKYFARPLDMSHVTRSALPQTYSRRRSINNDASTGFNDLNAANSSTQFCRPFTFDPLYVEDPLHPSNNVGRNAFRIFQIKVSNHNTFHSEMRIL